MISNTEEQLNESYHSKHIIHKNLPDRHTITYHFYIRIFQYILHFLKIKYQKTELKLSFILR